MDQFIPQFINVIATNNNLLMDELNVSYFAPKLWVYAMIWLPRNTDNSTHFAQSLEIRGIKSRLYFEMYGQNKSGIEHLKSFIASEPGVADLIIRS